ncbi:hypothetical protein ACQ3G6_04465 [Allorhizobium undicola]|uniref:hypothetical protein n=1 Tax=Allorhizobium undicola TaxID=78527 RepID=UPI00048017C9|nr:hypothetical protein [Allorhizobium undicola]
MEKDFLAAEAARRLNSEHDFVDAPEALQNAVDLVQRLAESGLDDVDEILDFTRQMGGKRYNPDTGIME